ncbi:alpha/beta hydrolase [Niveispirillum sp.]|uniref:alpha/beta hydrolase family protein n=1 Tax=Niveispirillum sp. TaxID=1917217 RepID=UPI001B743F42|nr:alpha/beta hydrolase [Niveispirillum sp.]MBP7339474.1 alpha/beta hydrolase [Niveispirillum sp.]
MYEPFPGNYVWNLSVNICIAMGGAMGEMEQANALVRAIAAEGEDKGTEALFESWGAMADRVRTLGEEAEAAGHGLSAAEKYCRATAYYMTAERMQSRHYAPRRAMYSRMLDTMTRAIKVGGLKCERVEIPYGDTSFPALFVQGEGEGPRPCMVFCNGLDSVKEMIYLSVRDSFAVRGISLLLVDQPGVGEALRLKGLPAIVEAERWAGAAVDYLETRADVDHDRIGMMGWSLGGYYAPRAACYEKRFKLCVAWGANHDWGELQRRRLAREGDRPVPHYWDHVMWVWGKADLDDFMAFVPQVTLRGHIANMTVPFLITHGVGDRQIPLEYARQCHEQAVNSPHRELKLFTDREGGVEHVSADNMEPVRSYIADWVADWFARMTA